MFACLMLALSVVPTIDAAVCGPDLPAAVGVQEPETGMLAAADHGGDHHRDGAGDACIHGHCHHAASLIGLASPDYALAQAGSARLVPAETGLPPSSIPDPLKKPPRV